GLQGSAQLFQAHGQRIALRGERDKLALGILTPRLALAQTLLGDRQCTANALSLAVDLAALGVQGRQARASLGLHGAYLLDGVTEASQFGLAMFDGFAQRLLGGVIFFDAA